MHKKKKNRYDDLDLVNVRDKERNPNDDDQHRQCDVHQVRLGAIDVAVPPYARDATHCRCDTINHRV